MVQPVTAVVGAAIGESELDDLSLLLGRLRGHDLSEESPDHLADGVVELRRLVDGLEVEWTRRVAHLDRSGRSVLDGHPSMTSFLKDRCHMAGSRAQRAVTLSHRLSDLPFVVKAFEADDLSLDQVQMFGHIPQHLSEDLAAAEVMLVNAATPLTVADTGRLLEYWKTTVDGPGTETTADELEERRYLFCAKTFEGMVKLDGLLDPVTGDLVLTALAAATPPRGRGDHRTPRQRRADALADLARGFLDCGEAVGTEKPHVLVITDLDALAGHGGGTHETGNGHVLTPDQIRRYACDCTISRVVFGANSETLDIGRATRIVPAAMRQALIARDRHCQHPGCDRSHRWCDRHSLHRHIRHATKRCKESSTAHHVKHWADGGPTALTNLKLLCRYHHTKAHRPIRPPPDEGR
jgi:uncharacterized protein DUF222/HNH endonuclease